jgi:hypothetical protein
MMRSYFLLPVLSLLVMGCSLKPSGMNSQRSYIRGGTDLAVTVSLDSIQSDAQAQVVKATVKDSALAISKFLKDGSVGDLTIAGLTAALKKIVPQDFYFVIDILLAQTQGVVLDVGQIGKNNVERLNSACLGMIIGCDLYDMQYRPVAAVVADISPKAKSVVASKPVVTKFAARLKRELKVK